MREIPLSQGKFALVDDEDFERINKFKWYASRKINDFYAVRNMLVSETKKSKLMHRHIIDVPEGLEIDHINGNGLDNRKENLRIVNHRMNAHNLHIEKSSRYTGVSKHKYPLDRQWQAKILLNGEKIFLGCFATEEEASVRYNEELHTIQSTDECVRCKLSERERVLCELLAYIHPDSRAGDVIKEKLKELRGDP